jgi:hypothetical protein
VFEIQNIETRLRAQYKNAIYNIRAGNGDESILITALDDFRANGISLDQFINSDLRSLKEKIQLITGLVAMGAKYIGYNSESLGLELGRTPDVDIYVFNFSESSRRDSKTWAKSISILYQLFQEDGPPSRILVRDCDATKEILDKPRIVLYRNAEMINGDIPGQRSQPTARYDKAGPNRRPETRFPHRGYHPVSCRGLQ